MYYCSSSTYKQIEKVLKYKMTDEKKNEKKWEVKRKLNKFNGE